VVKRETASMSNKHFSLILLEISIEYPVGKISEKAVCRSVFIMQPTILNQLWSLYSNEVYSQRVVYIYTNTLHKWMEVFRVGKQRTTQNNLFPSSI